MRRNFLVTFFVIIAVFLLDCLSIFAAERIEELFLRSDYPAVIEEASLVLSRGSNQPDLDRVYFYLGLSNMRMGNFSEARNDFNILLGNYQKSRFKERANLALADTYFLEENYLAAKKVYEKLAEDSLSNILSTLYYKLAQTDIKLSNWQEAKNYLEKVKSEFPLSFEASLARNLNSSSDFFTVQVGSFIDQEKAKKAASELKSIGFDSYVVDTISQGKTFYRVRVGKLSTFNEAKELEQKLSEKNYPTKIFP